MERKTLGRAQLRESEIKSEVKDTLSLKCLLDTQIGSLSK